MSGDSSTTESPTRTMFQTGPREPLAVELRTILDWIYRHEHRGEYVSEQLDNLVVQFEQRAWMRGNDHLPINDEMS